MQMSSKNKPVSEKQLTAAIIGCGMIAGGYDEYDVNREINTHARAYDLDKRTILVAAADPDQSKRKYFAQKWNVDSIYKDAREMLELHSPDIVSICSPDSTHIDMLRICLEFPSVRGVWCEKPIGMDADECAVVVRDYEERGVALLVNYMRSFVPSYISIRDSLKAERFGKVQKICAYYTKGIVHNGSHVVDLLLDWLGDPGSICVTNKEYDDTTDDPTVDAHLLFNGIPVHLIGLRESGYAFFEIEIYTERARIVFEEFGRCLAVRSVSAEQKSGHKVLGPPNVSRTELEHSMSNSLSCLVDAITGGLGKLNARRALRCVEITMALANSDVVTK